ncbi:LacI family transcriptional regulator [bacterium 1XD8-76]|nr:LacI family transcriptional regulator [bacterium 1XD8-76]
MKKKVLASLLCVAMTAATLVGCGNSTEPATETPAAEEEAPAAEEEAPAEEDGGAEEAEEAAPAGDLHFEIVSKGFQHQFWQAVLKGSEDKAKELGVTMNFVGPNSESDIADQVQMLNNAINAQPAAIGLAALDTNACLDGIQQAMDANIPIIGFDSGVPGAPEGAIWANCSTDNYAAGEMAAEETYKLIKDQITGATGKVRIGVMNQDATGESLINRGLGFMDKMNELITADGKTVSVIGNDKYVNDCKIENKGSEDGDVVIEVLVPAQVTSELSAIDCQTLLNKEDTICIYGSNQHSAEGMVTANENIGKLGKDVVGVGFDSGAVIKAAVKDGTFAGCITQAPVAMGEAVIQQLYNAATGATVEDVDTGCQWFTADNMDDPEIAQNLYD